MVDAKLLQRVKLSTGDSEADNITMNKYQLPPTEGYWSFSVRNNNGCIIFYIQAFSTNEKGPLIHLKYLKNLAQRNAKSKYSLLFGVQVRRQ